MLNPTRSLLATPLLTLLALAATPAFALEQRNFDHNFPLAADGTLRLANVAGTVKLVASEGTSVKVQVSAFGAKRAHVDQLEWVETTNRHGKSEWALSYPVEDYNVFHYPHADNDNDWGFWGALLHDIFGGHDDASHYLGEQVQVTSSARGSAPTLYADLTIAVPRGSRLMVRTLAGEMKAGALVGEVTLATGSGAVVVDGIDGALMVDTGSGAVNVGQVRGKIGVDTGSGAILIGELNGEGSLDTGSGSVRVDKVAASNLVVDTGSGSVDIRNGSIDVLAADTGSGAVTVRGVAVGSFAADTGSGSVTLEGSLAAARDIAIDTGSGKVLIVGDANADFDLETSLGSGRVRLGYDQVEVRRDGDEIVGARRGTGRTRIRVDTGSGGCEIRPGA